MARIDIMDISDMANGPQSVEPEGSAMHADYGDTLDALAKKIGSIGRVALEPDDDAQAVVGMIHQAGRARGYDVKITESGNTILFYIHGPQPEVFLRQYRLRDRDAQTLT